ncbi:MAG TPA: hypothetical protein VLV86_01305 [Vicinamibacterales bacterium]|nr:hypothetical protein [Vicinamibacterales bacterium]
MRTILHISCPLVVAAAMIASVAAQESKPLPKNTVRVAVPGCAHNYLFIVGPRTADESGSSLELEEGMRLRMNGPKKLMADIKAHQGSMIEITGTMKKGQYKSGNVGLGGGVQIGPSGGPGGSSLMPPSLANQIMIDVEGWRPINGNCS